MFLAAVNVNLHNDIGHLRQKIDELEGKTTPAPNTPADTTTAEATTTQTPATTTSELTEPLKVTDPAARARRSARYA